MMALAGLRKGEVCFAKWDWIQWNERILVVSNHEEFTTKNKLPRTISMHEDLVRILEPHRQADGYILSDIRSSQRTSRYRADFRKSFNRVCELASIRATPHDLRHSFASRHAVKGRSLHVIAGWLGHSTTWVTERYAHYQHSYDAAVNDM
jgi:integrase